MHARCQGELNLLTDRLAATIDTRLQDEHDVARRRRLCALPEEFTALTRPLLELLDRIFLDSRFDDTQLHSTLRGVELVAEKRTVTQRLFATLSNQPASVSLAQTPQSYFLQSLFNRVVFLEAHLVSSDLRWECGYRLTRLVGHTLAVVLFVWLAIGMYVSFSQNSRYLGVVEVKVHALATRVTELYKDAKPEAVPDVLTEARYLPIYFGLDRPIQTAHGVTACTGRPASSTKAASRKAH